MTFKKSVCLYFDLTLPETSANSNECEEKIVCNKKTSTKEVIHYVTQVMPSFDFYAKQVILK